jgi:endonuclease YncB( thermonuclease family)
MDYPFPLGRRRAFPVKIVDGDTFDACIDLGFGVSITHRIRLADINTPELNAGDDGTRERARVAREYSAAWLDLREAHWPLALDIYKSPDKYGRFVAKVYKMDGAREVCLNDALVNAGLAVVVHP